MARNTPNFNTPIPAKIMTPDRVSSRIGTLAWCGSLRGVPQEDPRVLAVVATPAGMRVFVARFFTHMVGEVVQVFWTALQGGEFITDAAAAAGTYRKQGTRWVIANGGVRPRRGRNLTGRFLSFAEREEIALARAAGESVRGIALRLGRSPSTISRELRRNAQAPGRYRATSAHAAAWVRASRPKPAKLATNLVLRQLVEQYLQ